jgi:hypothetical protein
VEHAAIEVQDSALAAAPRHQRHGATDHHRNLRCNNSSSDPTRPA